ncbi:hypothetical protein [Pseudomonas viridiflava]|uniref:hypothetical protein n=1 Tax=Pseudomonas viridiflava TaxID=33069 RepID=UPI000F041747|nr:hypothetical protein [Pseudomonas viridiflava]
MNDKARAAAIGICESVLREDYQYNAERGILRSTNRLIESLLGRTHELADAYIELGDGLAAEPRALKSFFEMYTAVIQSWNPKKIKQAREDREELTELNMQIAKASEILSNLLSRRTEVKERSGFTCDTYYHIMDVVEGASEGNGLFGSHLKEKLGGLTYQYDLKYWPAINNVVEQIGIDAAKAVTVARDSSARAATEARRPGLADFLKAFEAGLERNGVGNNGFIPDEFSLADSSVASLVNCGLELEADRLIDATFVKRYRQRERERKAGQEKGD